MLKRTLTLVTLALLFFSYLAQSQTWDISVNPRSGDLPLRVKFSLSLNNMGTLLYYAIVFGDGESAIEYSSTTLYHTYQKPGIYTVTILGETNHYKFKGQLIDVIKVSGVTDVSEDILIPEQKLNIYPNPCSDLSTIEFYLDKTYPVTLYVVDNLGNIVKNLIDNSVYDGGYQQITYDVSDLASGIYYYVLKFGKHQEMYKLIVAH